MSDWYENEEWILTLPRRATLTCLMYNAATLAAGFFAGGGFLQLQPRMGRPTALGDEFGPAEVSPWRMNKHTRFRCSAMTSLN